MTTLQEAVKEVHRLVLPDLNNDQLEASAAAAAEVLLSADGERLEKAEREALHEAVSAQIDRFSSR